MPTSRLCSSNPHSRPAARGWLANLLLLALILLAAYGSAVARGEPDTPATTPAAPEDPQPVAPTAVVTAAPVAPDLDVSIMDLRGEVHSLGPAADGSSLALVFLSTECPIANGFIPELNRIHAALGETQPPIRFFGVISDRSVTRAQAASHAQEFKIEFPVLFDASHDIAAQLKPTHTPEAFVLNAARTIVYRGRIDDTYAAPGKRRPQPTRHDFADAIAAVSAGLAVQDAVTTPVGCLFELEVERTPEDVTYNRDVAPILQVHCRNCHRAGEVAPFPLESFGDARKRAGQIVAATGDHFMPPWKPAPGFGHFLDERRLTKRELAVLAAWAETERPEGDPDDLPPAPKFAEGWRLGEPDLILKMPEEFEIPADGADVFRNFVIPVELEGDKLVAAAEFRPGNPRIVHHAIFYLDSNGVARKKDEADPGPGYGSFGGPGFLPTGAVGGWSPGGTPRRLPDDMGRYLKQGSDLVMQIHYHPSGKVERDQSLVGLHFVKRPSQKIVAGILIADRRLDIPADEPRHQIEAAYELPNDVTMVGVVPHMHLLGREMKVTATLPDGQVEPLVWIQDWNFNWQDEYLLKEQLRLPRGTRLHVEAVYDNSSSNPVNPSSPPKRVTWGEQTTDEMFVCFFLVSTEKPQDLLPLIIDNFTSQAYRLKKVRSK